MKKAAIKEQDILSAYNLKQIDFDPEDLHMTIAEISSQIDGLCYKGDAEFCALHISRMKQLVTLYTALNENIDKHYFILYLESAMAICPHITDFFSYRIVCDDFQAMIDKLKASGESLLRCLTNEEIDHQPLPHGSKWELIFVTQLQTEIPEKPSQYADILTRVKGLSDGGYFAPVRAKLFLDSCGYLLADREADQFVYSAPRLVSYLFVSTKYSKVGELHGKLLKLLLIKAQNRVPHAMQLLCEFADNLIIDGGLDLVEKVLNAIVKPKKPTDNDLNYYSSFALGRILCLVLNKPRLAQFAIHPNQMNDLQSTFYHRSLANYFTDYFTAIVAKHTQNTDFELILELLRLYQFARKELPDCGFYQRILKVKVVSAYEQRIASHAKVGAKQQLGYGDLNVYKIGELFTNNLLDCFSYRDLTRALIQIFDFALAQVVTPEDLLKSDPIYSSLFATLSTVKRADESEKQFHNRMACVIMLSYRYSLVENTWNHFATILGEDKNIKELSLENYVKKHPREMCKSLLLVFRQHQRFFPNVEIATPHLVSSVYAWSEEAAGLKAVDPELDAKMGTILSKLSPAGMIYVFQLPAHCFTALMKDFASEIVKRWCEILRVSYRQFTNATLKPLCQYLNVIGNHRLMMQVFDAARLESNETFEDALICFRADNLNSAAFIFNYMKRFVPQSLEKKAFIRCLDIILAQVPSVFWPSRRESPLSMLLFDLCTSGVDSRHALLTLLELGADPVFRVNNTCAFLESIKLCASGNGSLLQICEYMRAMELKIDFNAMHAICEDPLGLACRFEVPTQIIELMLLIGFDFAKYKVSEPMMAGHQAIMTRLPAQPALAKSGSTGRDMFGFFRAEDEEDEAPEIYCDPISYELMENPVLCLLDKKTYDEASIRGALTVKPCSPFDEKAVLGKRSIDEVLVENKDLKTAIEEYKSAHPERYPPKKNGLGNNNNAKKHL